MATLRQTVFVRAEPERVRDAVLDEATLSRVLGHACRASPEQGGAFSLWDGLITGSNEEVGVGHVVQDWRYAMAAWPEGVMSRVEMRFAAEGKGTRVSLLQTDIPAGCGQAVEEHWRDHLWPGIKAALEPPARHDVGSRRLFR